MHCPSLRGTSEAEGVIVNVIVNVIVIKSYRRKLPSYIQDPCFSPSGQRPKGSLLVQDDTIADL